VLGLVSGKARHAPVAVCCATAWVGEGVVLRFFVAIFPLPGDPVTAPGMLATPAQVDID
jgi:hypothetical protein